MIRKLLPAALAGSLMTLAPLAGPAHAQAPAPSPAQSPAQSPAPVRVSHDFAGGPAGWTQSAAQSGLCVPSLLCPEAANSWSAGGADGNGYVRTQFSSLLTTLAGTSTGTWESPAFTYDGVDGAVPGSVTFDMSVLRNVGALLDLSLLNDTSYQVDLVDQATGNLVSVVPAEKLVPSASWTAIPTVQVSPSLLRLGHSYTIRITTTYHAVATVVATGEVGYDDVTLTATAPGSDGAQGAGGSPNGGSNGGSGITDIKQLRKLVKHYILPQQATVSGRLLVVHLRCPAVASPKPCQIQLQGLQKGRFSQPATARKVLRLKAGKERTVKIRIKPAYVAAYAKASRIWVKAIVRVGKVRVTVHKRIGLR